MVSLLGLAALSSSGCLVAEAPEYGPPKRTPPVIDFLGVFPSAFAVLVPTNPQGFTIPVQSQDAGDGLVAYLWTDYDSPEADFKRAYPFPPSSTTGSRDLKMTWDIRDVSEGCHLLTMFVTHDSNFDVGLSQGRDPKDVGAVNWWANFGGDNDTLINDCPAPSDSGPVMAR